MKFLLKNDDVIITAVSEFTKEQLVYRYGFNDKRIIVISEGVNHNKLFFDNRAEVLRKFNIDTEYILYLGALDPRKGLTYLLDAFSNIKNKDIKLVIAGSPWKLWDFDECIKDYKDKDRLILTGYVSDEEKRVLLSCMECFIFPSLFEGFGLPVLEAMTCHAPVICSNSSSIPEVGGDAVLYCEPQNTESLLNQIDKVLDDSHLRKELIKKGIDQSKKFTWDNTADLMEKAFELAR